MCQLCREISQTTYYSCGHEVTRTVEVPWILLWHKERKKVTLRNKYGRRKLCRDCRSSSGRIEDKRKELQGAKGNEEVPAMATGGLLAEDNGDAADARAGNAGDANRQGQQDNNDVNDGGPDAAQGNDVEGAAFQQDSNQVPNTDGPGLSLLLLKGGKGNADRPRDREMTRP